MCLGGNMEELKHHLSLFYCKRYLLESLSKEDKTQVFIFLPKLFSSLTYSYDVKGVYYVYEKIRQKRIWPMLRFLSKMPLCLKIALILPKKKISLLQEIRP
jgi:hypothetical protein